MKNIYATLLTGTALLLAGALDAQSSTHSKTGLLSNPTKLTAPGAGTHQVAAGEVRGGAPVNDLCSSVTFSALAGGSSVTFAGDNTNATDIGDYEAGSGLETFGPVVWHGFTTTECTNISVAYCGTTPAYQNLAAFLARTCPATDADYVLYSSGNFTDCVDGNGTITWLAVPAGSYYLPVLNDAAAPAVGPYTILVSAVACPSAPANDECAAAISLTSTTICSATPFSTNGATQTLAPIECGGFTSGNANDVFFSFVATSNDQTIGVAGYNAADAMIELFSGSCGSLVSLGCADATYPLAADETTIEQLIQGGLTVGTTYYVRVYDWGHASAAHNFDICVTEGSGNNVGIHENSSASAFSVFPNPAEGLFNVQYLGTNGAATIQVLDLTGRLVYNWKGQFSNGAIRTIDLSGMAQGNYVAHFTVGGVRTTERLMVK